MTVGEPITSGDGDSPGGDHAGTIPDRFFRTIVESVDDGIFAIDESGTVIYANSGMGDAVGYPPADIVGEELSSVVPEAFSKYRKLARLFTGEDPAGLDGTVADIPAVDRDGDRVWLSIALTTLEYDEQALLIGTVRDVSVRHERKKELERYERIIETIDDVIYVLDENFTITNVNEAVVSMTGYTRDELIGSHASILASEDLIEQAAERSVELLESDRETATIVSEIATKDGGSVPIETRFSLYSFEDGRFGQLGVVRDISDRKQFEETLTALHNSTRELLAVDSRSEVSTHIVETATDVLNLSSAAIYLIDPDENVLRPTACSDDAGGSVDDWPTLEPDTGIPWQVFVNDQKAVIDSGPGEPDSSLPIESGLCVPLGDHGVFVFATANRDALDDDKETLVRLLAASAEEALSRLDREHVIRERDRRLERQNRRLRRLDKVNAIIRDIDQVLVEAESTDEIGDAVCDRLVASDRFAFAWVGELRPADGTVHPRSWSGDGSQYLDDVDFSLGDSREPAVAASTSTELTVVPDVGADLRSEPWRKAALSRDYRSVLSVPLTHGDLTHGVLTVYANETEAFDGMETVFSELGETIANAINAVATKRALLTDSQTELRFRLDVSDDILQRVARQTGSPIEVEGVVPQADGVTRVFFTTARTDPEDFRVEQERSVSVESVDLVAQRDEDYLFEAVLTRPTALSTIVDHGAKIRTVTATGEELTVDVAIPNDADVRGFVEFIQSQFPGAELVSKTERDRPLRTATEFQYEFENRLTDRQMEVLRIAYLRGFFEWPRESSGQEVADSLDISQPTVNRHLRTSERKLFSMLFDGA